MPPNAHDALVQGLGGWVDLIGEVQRAGNGTDALKMIWRYILTIDKRRKPEEVVAQLVEAVGQESKEDVVTAADQLREEGRKKGRTEGRKEGLQEGECKLLLKLLSTRFGALPEAVVARVNAADPTQLEVWAERILSASSLVDVLGEL